MAWSVLCWLSSPLWIKVSPLYIYLSYCYGWVDSDWHLWPIRPGSLFGWFHHSWPPDSSSCQQNLATAWVVCKQLGLPLHPQKCEGPALSLDILGIHLNSIDQTAQREVDYAAEATWSVVRKMHLQKESVGIPDWSSSTWSKGSVAWKDIYQMQDRCI